MGWLDNLFKKKTEAGTVPGAAVPAPAATVPPPANGNGWDRPARSSRKAASRGTGKRRRYALGISEKELIQNYRAIRKRLRETPSRRKFDSLSKISVMAYRQRFGSWSQFLQKVDEEPLRPLEVTKQDLVSEWKRLRKQLGRTPRHRDLAERGRFGSARYLNTFGSWDAVCKAMGDEPSNRYNIPEEELTAEYKRLRRKLGGALTQRDMDEHGKFSAFTYRKRFGSWGAARRKMGDA